MNFKIVFLDEISFFNNILHYISPLSPFNIIYLNFSEQKLTLTSEYYGDKSNSTIPKYKIEIDLEEKVDRENYIIRKNKNETFLMEFSNFQQMITRCVQNELNQISLINLNSIIYFKIENNEPNNISISYKYMVSVRKNFGNYKEEVLDKNVYFRSLLKCHFLKNFFETYEKEKLSLNLYSEDIRKFLIDDVVIDFENDNNEIEKDCVVFEIKNEDENVSLVECIENMEVNKEKFWFEFNIYSNFCKIVHKLCQKGEYLYVSLNLKNQIIFEIEDEDFYCSVLIPMSLKQELN